MRDSNSSSLEEKVFLLLEEEILSGKLKPGECLREIALATRLEVSRTPVRDALRRLAEEGLVTLSANRGATVVGITEADIEDIYAVRMRLEGLAARLAAARIGESDIEELRRTLELSEFYLSRKGESGGDLDSEFHSIIFNACGSRHLCRILSELHKNVKAYRRHSLSRPERAERSLLEHRRIFEAIEARNPDEAERLTAVHINNALLNFKGIKT